ncbi:MAG TPA: amino acid adenylation domain-containing protein, partial [Chitinophagaceae bacterium]|nr:amino acid adenylation domain-containing protein [Chitinophagaceae bacterium]
QLKKWNNTWAEYPKEKSLVALLHEVAVQHSDKVAIEFKQQKISYKDLDEKSSQFANLLLKQGGTTGQAIGLAVDRSPEMIIALLAIMKSGAAYVPLDPEYPRERVEYMLQDSNAKILITSKKYSHHFKSDATELIIEDCLSQLSQFSNEFPSINLNGSDLAYILYTSGSTGKPKGVQIKHHNLVNFLLSMQKMPGISANDSLLAITTISFDIAGLELYLPLVSGAKVVLADTETAKDAYRLLALIKEKNITMMQATPSTWRMLLDSGWNKPFDFTVLCGGEALPKDIADKLVGLCSSLWNMYGPTETTIWSTVKQITADSPSITIGRPIDNTQVYILDEYLKNVPAGATGEIFIAGDGVAKGYFHKPELTAERFLPNPFTTDSTTKMYRTGDLGKFLENGEILCLGRIDQQVKVRGHRIELGEIEYSLGKLEGIKEAVVVATEDIPGNQKLAAYVIPEQQNKKINYDSKEQKLKWRDAIKEVLPHYMVPNDWIILTEFPLTPNNKIDKKALPKPPSEINGYSKKSARLPVTQNEKLIAKIWEEELGRKNVTLDDDFFDLGGHSLIAVKMMNHLEKETGKRIPLTALFEGPTVEKLASLIEKNDHKWDSFVSIKSSGSKIPIYLIHGVGLNVLIFSPLAKYLHKEQPIYGIQAKGLNGIDKLFDRMEDIAAHYIDEIMKQNPQGPYAIGGYSFGGLIAFEMSKQLKAMGKKVILTCMFDSCAFESHHHKPLHKKMAFKTHEIFMRVVYALYFMMYEPKIVITNKIRYAKILLKSFFDKITFNKVIPKDEKAGYSKRATEMYDTAFRNYTLTPYDGTIDVFRSKKQTYYMPDFKYLGWKPYALKGVVVHEVPGYHLDMFKYPNVEEFAKILQARLDEVTSESPEKE